MIDRNKNGLLAEIEVIKEALKRGFIVSKPIGDHYPYDLIIDNGHSRLRVQVKWANQVRNGAVVINIYNRPNGIAGKTGYDETDTDLILVYIPMVDKIINLPLDKVRNKSTFMVRLNPPKNNQQVGINFVKDYYW